VLAALPSVTAPLPTTTRTRRIVREQRVRRITRQISALRGAGKTWADVAATVGLSSSRVRDLHASADARRAGPRQRTTAALDDDAILANVRAFVTTGGAMSRRAYAAWPNRLAAPATIENRFGSWAHAVHLATRAPEETTYRAADAS